MRAKGGVRCTDEEGRGEGVVRDVLERPYTAGGGGLPPPPLDPPPSPPLPIFEADSHNVALAPSPSSRTEETQDCRLKPDQGPCTRRCSGLFLRVFVIGRPGTPPPPPVTNQPKHVRAHRGSE